MVSGILNFMRFKNGSCSGNLLLKKNCYFFIYSQNLLKKNYFSNDLLFKHNYFNPQNNFVIQNNRFNNRKFLNFQQYSNGSLSRNIIYKNPIGIDHLKVIFNFLNFHFFNLILIFNFLIFNF